MTVPQLALKRRMNLGPWSLLLDFKPGDDIVNFPRVAAALVRSHDEKKEVGERAA